jgi:hypothetical protein
MMALFQAFALPGAKTRSKINKASILMSWVISFYRAAGCSLAKLHPLGSLPSIDRWERIVSLHAYLIFFFGHVEAHQGTNSKNKRSMVATTCATHLGGDHLTYGTATLSEERLRSTFSRVLGKN